VVQVGKQMHLYVQLKDLQAIVKKVSYTLQSGFGPSLVKSLVSSMHMQFTFA
jgi:hypothetical protein